MSELSDRFRELVGRGDLSRDIQIVYRVPGGVPDEHVEEEFRLSGSSEAQSKLVDAHTAEAIRDEVSVELDDAETENLLNQVALTLDDLAIRSDARFLPDSAVGSVTIEVGGEQETRYFLADEGQRHGQDEAAAPRMPEALKSLEETSQRLLS